MAGSTFNHGRIVRNLSTKLNESFQNKSCEVFTNDLRIRSDAVDWFVYPDITVICERLQPYENRRDTIINPLLIVEVLSDTTEDYDRGTKFTFYRSIPTLREYILIDQHKIHIEQFSLGADGKWVLTEYFHADDILRCASVDFQIPLREVYDRVEFAERGERST